MASFLQTHTSEQQHELELKVSELYRDLLEYDGEDREEMLLLLRDRHTRYLQGGLGQLPGGFVSLDASRPWICYWVLHGLALLEAPLPKQISASDVVSFLSSCQHPQGGYGGGPCQLAHLAPTYAAVSALLTLGGQEALSSINRRGVWQFLNRMAIPPEQGGGFRMHDGGESDVRSCYTAMAVATSLCLDAKALAAKAGMVDYVRRCQTYEGGIGGEPGNEAHGGYTYCGLAALCLAGCPQALDLTALLHWAVQRQGWVEGGFNGRTNKLVDGCYSFWQGGVFPILQQIMREELQQQVPPELDVPCVGAVYPPTAAPQHWQDKQQQQQQQLVVPYLPDLSRVQGPVEQAESVAGRLNAAYETLAEAVLTTNSSSTGTDTQQVNAAAGSSAAAAAAATAGQGGTEASAAAADAGAEAGAATAAGSVEGVEGETRPRESRLELLKRAEAAEQAADYAEECAQIAGLSAAVLFPCSADAAAADADAAAAGSSGSSAALGGEAAGSTPNPLFNTRALQLWILRGCQQLKGGLRDKPGKSADYYHTCYCLSGLSAAQHMAGGSVLGPVTPAAVSAVSAAAASSGAAMGGSGGGSDPHRGGVQHSNMLAAADPLLNIVVHKVAETREFFSQAEGVE